jgi:hypothetical protein
VVEVKHYLKAAPKSFGAALDDYARGRPCAKVILVDYGPAEKTILDRVGPNRRARCAIVGEYRPDSTVALERFQSLIDEQLKPAQLEPQKALPGEQGIASEPYGASEAPEAKPLSITLAWAGEFHDLDVHTWFADKAGVLHHLYHAVQLVNLPGTAAAKLDRDCTEAPGREVVTIEFLPASVRCAIHNYSHAGSSGLATLTVQIGQRALKFECRELAPRSWWLVCDLLTSGSEIRVMDKISSDEPAPDPSWPGGRVATHEAGVQ